MDSKFLSRLEEIVAPFGSRAAFARKAGIPVSSLHSYMNGHEPTRQVLLQVAQTAGVSVSWLATGEGQRNISAAPEGYFRISYYDLEDSGPYLRSMLGGPIIERLFKLSDFPEWVRSFPYVCAVEGCKELSFRPLVLGGDTFVFDLVSWRPVPGATGGAGPVPFSSSTATSKVKDWLLTGNHEDIYFVADGLRLCIRKLRRRGDSVLVIDEEATTTRTLKDAPHDFVLFGRIIWRGGTLPAGWVHPISGRDESP